MGVLLRKVGLFITFILISCAINMFVICLKLRRQDCSTSFPVCPPAFFEAIEQRCPGNGSRAASASQMICKMILAGFILLAGAGPARGVTIAMNALDAVNTTSFNTGLHWTGGAVPAAGTNYQTAAFRLRTPANAAAVTFAGDSLEIQAGGELRIKTGATVTVTNLILAGTALVDLTAPMGGNAATLAGNITLNGTVTLQSGLNAGENVDVLTVTSIISGTGGITTAGSFGTIILAATNTYSGGTTVNGGTVLVNGILANTVVTISAGTLGGNGTIKSAVTCQAGGTLQPGLGGADTSTLTISNTLAIAGTTVFTLNRDSVPSAGKISGISTLTQGGTLTVNNAGAALQLGDSFVLFNTANYTGNFTTLNLPALNSGLGWSNSLSVNGSLVVVTAPLSGAGIWTNDASGNWSTAVNWLGGVVASGTGSNADFSTINLTADRTVTLDSSRNVGNLLFGDTSGSQNWFVNASGGSVLTLAVAAGSPAITVNNNTATLNLPLAGTAGLTKAGGGTLVLSGNNSYSGATIVSAGTMSVASVGGGAAAAATLTVGNTAGTPAVLNILPGANVTNYNLTIGGNATAAGAVFQSGGALTQAQVANIANFRLGGVANGYGYYNLSGGTLTVNEIGVGSDLAGSIGVMDITGGSYISSGYVTLARGIGTLGALNVSGGTMTLSGTAANSTIGLMWNGSGGSYGLLNIYNGGSVIGPANTTYVLNYNPFPSAGTTQSGVVNLGSGGTLQIGGVKNSAPATGISLFNFNGGTLKATVANPTFFTPIYGAYIYSGGAIIDDNGTAITISQPLLAPAGYGVSSISLTSGGSGYIGAPFVLITGGSGIGATAVAQVNFTGGVITNLLVTSPGSGYLNSDALTVILSGGGGGATVGAVSFAANISGGLTKTGTGTLTFSAANTFTGGMLVGNGTLALGASGSLASTNISVSSGATFDVSAITFSLVAGQSLSGSGTNVGAVSTVSGSKIFAGTDGGKGTNTFTSNLTFMSGSSAQFDLSSTAGGSNDKIILNGAGSVLTCGGASIGINCGATLDQSTDYPLFNLTGAGASIAGNFNATPVWTGTTPANSNAYSVVTFGSLILLHYSTGATNPPAVTNLAASGVLATTATLNGQVLATGGQFPTVKIYYGTSNGVTNAAAWTTNVSLGLQGGAFAAGVSNLIGNTTYYFTAFATNSAGATWAAPSQSFTTPAANLAVVSNSPAANVQGASAILNGQVVSTGSQTPAVTLYYGPANGGTNAGAWANSIYLGTQGGGFSVTAMGLVTNTLYYFTAAAVNSDGTAWAQPALSFTTLPTAPVVSMLTYHYDNARTGANTNEVLLTPAQVNTNNFGRLIKYVTDGYIYTQPLYVPNVAIPGQGTHNVVYVASEHDTVYAFDADSNLGANGGLLWKTNLGLSALSANGEFGARYCITCFPDIVPEVGITGTPVIDPATGTLYVNVATREVSGTTNYIHRLHAINITNGTERSYSPVVVSGSVPGTGVDSVGGVMTFNGRQANQRPALTLAGGILYVAYAGYADTDPYHGWLFGYNATNLAQVSIYNTTPNATTGAFGSHAAEGGIWMGGHGLVVDANTNLYFITGNGSFSQNTNGGDYADTVMKLATTNGLTVADYFTPFNQLVLANADTDLGSVGPVLLPDSVGSVAHPHLLAAGGKSGTIYLLDRDNMGQYNTANNNQIVQSVIGATAQIWSSPAYWNNLLFYQPASSTMKAFTITNGVITTTPVAATASFGTYNGGGVVSANGTNNGIVWVINGVGGGSTEVLYAYNATNISQTLYSSSQLLARDNPGNGIKMITPTVANGKVYVGAQYALNVYGFTTFLATPTISPNGATYTNSVTVMLADATPGAAIYYTLDGTTPSTNSFLYTAPFIVTTTLNVTAIAVKSGAANSGVASASFINTAALGTGTGLLGQYWTNTTSTAFTNISFATAATLTRTDALVNFNWSSTAPSPVIGQTNFTVRWTGSVQPQYSETYTFTTIADDGVRLWINGQLLLNDWTAHTAATTNSGVITLAAQQLYNLRLEYFQNTSNAVAQLLWSGPSTALAVIPTTQLYAYTNPPPSVVILSPTNNSTYTASASVTITADADAPYNPLTKVNFYTTNGATFLGSVSNAPYTLTTTGLAAGNYGLIAVATDGSGLSRTSAVVNISVASGSGQPYGLTTRGNASPYLNMPTTSGGSLPLLLSQTGIFSNTPAMTPINALLPYTPNTALWSDGAVKTRYVVVPNNGGVTTPDEQITFAPTGSWTFPAGTVFVKTFELQTNETLPNAKIRLETRLLVRDLNGQVYGVTYKWRADNSEADLLASSLTQDIPIITASGVRTQTWYYPSPADCLTCHTPVANYVLGLSTRQLNGNQTYPSTSVTDNQLRTYNRLGLFNPAFNEATISNFTKMFSLTNLSASLESRSRSYLDANCAQCHQPGGNGITFDSRFDTPLASQNITNYPAALSLGYDNARIVKSKDIWRSVIYHRLNSLDPAIKMPPLARNLVDTNAVAVITDWINSLPGTPALAPPTLTPNGGSFIASVSVSAQSPDTNAAIYYTLDGTLPTTNSLPYVGPINLYSNATISANVFETGYNNSVAVTALFLVQPLYFASEDFSNSVFQLKFFGAAGSNYVLQASTNLVNWTPISTNLATTNLFYLIDPKASNYPSRFYRVLQK